ncbi:Stk1 family PASTA domain-containing Ser/Thr kinase [Falsibacillus albus]|uniref:Serine/threonine-protein kinase PrkC n=1 Tax=Falsibacillus albus TaxID=2478915 RepID=A0A3L7K071_9BACI|nr:Stk1 family PASTA domain-containing Ser/Thr kinase [Falsibacillus albus]RLQ95789.1 Stk1 family PASTA domain-containing Ser/Thr kinase [Falsibacillus albus]
MLIGKRISGRYKILDMIGGGGMANVYLARDMILDRDVAVKILRLDFANEEEFIKRFQREAQSATSIVHPNIVSIYDVGEEDDIYYIVMEYVEGMTLKQYIAQNYPISIEKSVDIMKQLTSAITHAHENHIVHRDIKPHNILVDHDGNVKITDFGIAMALSATSITQTNSVLGSVHYLSPEQARGGMATKKSDIYSLGIVMFELLTGRLPFSGESAVSIALKHLQSETPSPRRWNDQVPQSVENIVLKATAKDPFQRYESVEAMEADLDTALNPDRLNEPKFFIPVDDDATKAIPVITNDRPYNLDETRVHEAVDNDVEDTAPVTTGKKDSKKNKKKKKKWPWVVTGILAILILGLLAFLYLPGMLGPKRVEVPDVQGMSLEKAISSIYEAGFDPGKSIQIPDDTVPEGDVIKTDPTGGNYATEGSKIKLYISTGKEKVTMDDYNGQQFDQVKPILEAKGFKVKEETQNSNEDVGTIIDQDPNEGDEVIPEETEITFTVSKGPAEFPLEDLTNYPENAVKNYIDREGLSAEEKEDYSDTVPKGQVMSQDPAPNTKVKKGDHIIVTFSKGPKEIPPKTKEKNVTVKYEPTEDGKPQTVQVYIEDMNRKISDLDQSYDITEDKDIHMEFTLKQGETGHYRIVRDGTVYEEGEVPNPEE